MMRPGLLQARPQTGSPFLKSACVGEFAWRTVLVKGGWQKMTLGNMTPQFKLWYKILFVFEYSSEFLNCKKSTDVSGEFLASLISTLC
jgi:hypothetical protein